MASKVTMPFFTDSVSSSAGIAVISFDLPSTSRWPSTKPCSLAQALTRCNGPCARPRSKERRSVWPSIATTSRWKTSANDWAQALKQASKASGSISMKTRRKVLCEGMPWDRVKKDCRQPSLLRPQSAMSSQLSAHAFPAHPAMTRRSVSRCSTLPAHRGSASAEKCSTSFSTDIATLPSLIKGEPAQPVSPSEPARPFHALPLTVYLIEDDAAVRIGAEQALQLAEFNVQ